MTSSPLLPKTFIGLIALVLLPWAFGQQTGQTGDTKGSGNTGNASRGNTPTQPTTRTQPEIQKQAPQLPRMLFFSGTVVQEDGTPLPPGAVIERICNGRTRTEASVDSTGHFSFQVGGTNNFASMIPQASDDSSFGEQNPFGSRDQQYSGQLSAMNASSYSNLSGCELRARLPGYRSNTVILQGPYDFGQIDVGTILLSPSSRVAGTLVSVTSLQAPKDAQKALERAQKDIQKKNLAGGEKNLNTAIELYPKYAAAWFALGQIYQQQQRYEDASKAYATAVSADGKFVSPYIRLAQLAGLERKWQEVADLTDRALALDPLDFPEGYFYNSVAYYNLKKLDVAERSAWKVQRLDGLHRYPQVHLMLADILERKQDSEGTIDQLQKYLKFAPKAADAEQVRSRLQEMQKSAKILSDKPPSRP